MKILHVLYSGLGGHGNVFFSLVDADTNHEFEYEALFNGIEDVRSEYTEKCNALGIKWHFVKKYSLLDVSYYKRFIKIIKTSNAEIIFLHSSAYIFQAKLATLFSKKKIVVRETQANNLKCKKEWISLYIAFLFANKIVFLSEAYKSEIEKKLNWFYNKKKVAVIPNGIDLTIFHPRLFTNNTYITLGMQSRLAPNKDHKTLLHAFTILKNEGYNLKLKIAGYGSCLPDLMLLSKKLHIENDLEFLGMLEENELVKFLQNINIYIHASFGETMSTAIMQAMACGLPIIASNVPGINNMIEEGKTGILVTVNNAQSLAEGIIKCINNKKLMDTVAENGLVYARGNFSGKRMFDSYKKLIFHNLFFKK